jgi:PilZ domain
MAMVAASPQAAPAASPHAGAAAELPNADYLLESLVSDVHSLAVHVASLAMLISAKLRPDAAWTLRACRHLVHDDFKPLTLTLRYSEQIGLDAETATQLSDLCKAVFEWQKRIIPLLQVSAATKLQRDQIRSLSDGWRRLAKSLAAALAAIEPTVRARLNSTYAYDSATLREFLRRAADNDTSAVDVAGVISPPALKQRRRGPRVVANRACTVETEAGSHPARLEDVSRHGLGLMCDLPLSAGQKVAIVLADGRRLQASIVRVNRPRYGMLLAAPLSDVDPLLGGD